MAYIQGPFGNIWVPDLPQMPNFPQLPSPIPGLLPQLPSPSQVFGAIGTGLNTVAGAFGLPPLPVPQGTNQTTVTTYGPGGQPVTGNVALGNKFVTDEEFAPFAQALAQRVQALEGAAIQQQYAGGGDNSSMMLMMVLLLGSGTGTGTGTLDTTTLLILMMVMMGDKGGGGFGGGGFGGDNSTMMLMMVLLLGGSI